MREDEEVDGEGDEGEASEERGTCPVRPVFAGARDGECAEVGDGCGRGRVEHDMGHVGETRGECAAVGHRELAREEELYCVVEGWACEGRERSKVPGSDCGARSGLEFGGMDVGKTDEG